MKNLFIAIAGLALLTTGCVSKKKYAELEARNKQTIWAILLPLPKKELKTLKNH